MLKIKILIAIFAFTSINVLAQFNSGSTGADGALDLSNINCPNNVCEIQLPESGVLNYTTVLIPQNKGLVFKANARNTPVMMLAQGNVTILGQISVATPPGSPANVPGNGGFYGGDSLNNGFGPGGGTASNIHATWTGPLNLNPIVGGSGGFGMTGSKGGGGGGALLIASSTSVTVSAGAGFGLNINARGSFYSSLGSGGAIRIVANSVNVSGWLDACNPATTLQSICGVIRLEALQGQLSFSGTSNPPPILAPFTAGSVPTVSTNNLPQLSIVSVGGYAVPVYSGSRFDTVDLLLPNQIADPIAVFVQGVNIPAGTRVQIGFVNGSANAVSTPCTMTGGPGPTGCTATISGVNRNAVTYLLATAVFAPPSALARVNPSGQNHVAQIKLETKLAASNKFVFLDSKSRVIDISNLPREFLAYFGM